MKEVVKTPSNSITDIVTDKIRGWMSSGQLNLPDNYSVENAVKSFYVKLVELDAFNKCTRESVVNAFIDLALQGLSPSKNQAYPIIYNNKLKLHRSYFGSQSVAKRITGAKSIVAVTIHEGDDIEIGIEKGMKTISHKPKFSTLDNPIIGAYCLIELPSGEVYTEIMTIKEIHTAWGQSNAKPFDDKGNLKKDSAHFKFPQEMAKRTVINRACKNLVNTSDDSDLVIEAFNRTTEAEFTDNSFEVEAPEEITAKVAVKEFKEETPTKKAEPKIIDVSEVKQTKAVTSLDDLFGDEPAPKDTQAHINSMIESLKKKNVTEERIKQACANTPVNKMTVNDAKQTIEALSFLITDNE